MTGRFLLDFDALLQTAATEVGVPPVAAPTAVDDASIGRSSADGDEGEPFTPDDSPAGDGPGAERPVPGNPQDSPTDRDPEAQPEPPVVATTGRSGDDTPAAAVDQVALVAQQPGLDLPEARTPEGPVERNAPGVPSPSFEGSDNGDGLEEGRDLPARPSSSDPTALVDVFAGWVEAVDDLDPQALGPLLTDEQLATLYGHVDDLAQFVGLLERWRTP